MSKSKRILQDVPPSPRRRFLRNAAGEVRPIWRLLAMIVGYFTLTTAARLGLRALLRALFQAWNLNAQTVARAPGWARTLYAWQGSLITLIVDGAGILFITLVCRARLRRPDVVLGTWWGVGTGIALVYAALFLLLDSLRLQWPLSRPHVTFGLLPLWALYLLTILTEELFTKGVVFDSVKRHWDIIWATAASALTFFLTNGGYSGTWLSTLNVALTGVLCALLYDRHGLWAPVGFRWGWGFFSAFLLGQGGGDRAVYRLYGVSENLFTGGDAGMVYGLGMTGILIVLLAMNLRRPGRTRDGSLC